MNRFATSLPGLGEIPLREAAAAIVVLLATLAVVRGVRRSPIPWRTAVLPGAGLLVAALAAALAPQLPPAAAVWTIVALVALCPMVESDPPDLDAAQESGPAERCWALAACGFAAWMLSCRLASGPTLPLVWEPEVYLEYESLLRAQTSFAQFLGDRLSWGWGLVSTSWDALLYGSATYLVMLAGEVSVFGQRIASAVFAAACLPAAGLLGWQVGGRRLGLLCVAVMALEPPLMFYGRYGIGLSAAILSVLLAVSACLFVLRPEPRPWWAGTLAGFTLALATFSYAPARLVALTLAAVTIGLLIFGLRRRWDRAVILFQIVAIVLGLVVLEHRRGDLSRFVHGRGEQLWSMMRTPWLVSMHLEVPGDRRFSHREVALMLVERTVPQAVEVLARPVHPDLGPDDIMLRDPPWLPLLPSAFIPLALLGCARSLRSLREPRHLILMAVAAAALPMVLTTRIDAHRWIALVVPLVLWTGLGITTLLGILGRLGIRRSLSEWLLTIVGGLVAAHSASLIQPSLVDEGPLPALYQRINAEGPPLLVALDSDYRVIAGVRMALTRRWLASERTWNGRLMDADFVAVLSDPEKRSEASVKSLVAACRNADLLFFPEERFPGLAEGLRSRGLRILPVDCGGQSGFIARRGS